MIMNAELSWFVLQTDTPSFRLPDFLDTWILPQSERAFFFVANNSVCANSVSMNATTESSSPRKSFNWRDDLGASRDLSRNEVQSFGFVIGWFDDWRVRAELPPGAESAREFWRVAVKSKPRQDWQLSQWAEGMRWYLKWGQGSVIARG